MRLTQGQFSFLPDLTVGEITAQVQYALDQGWAVAVEFTDDPHPRNSYWTMWGNPMFDLRDAKGVTMEIDACRTAHPDHYVKVLAFDGSEGFETVRMSFLVNRPAVEPGFELLRAEGPGRRIGYTVRSYATGRPAGERYGTGTGHGG
ncbi:ribulose 1,5-bisphosphate carboxylase small subunit [Azospirillum thiophilum]|uniref:Ribulose bisphosphate carboxylase small subunit n=2 Tax=Azospirillaceae TaxID=2829815 RepID=A0AAC8W076_9PROT|nr:ribulose 1,5-bisphosphate carboxylase small subunit [Azospirillum thiophilum]KJR64435.1 ribulose 1,5-bisphosphate carboxylase small subunit [Azospirillum thiophilum]